MELNIKHKGYRILEKTEENLPGSGAKQKTTTHDKKINKVDIWTFKMFALQTTLSLGWKDKICRLERNNSHR